MTAQLSCISNHTSSMSITIFLINGIILIWILNSSSDQYSKNDVKLRYPNSDPPQGTSMNKVKGKEKEKAPPDGLTSIKMKATADPNKVMEDYKIEESVWALITRLAQYDTAGTTGSSLDFIRHELKICFGKSVSLCTYSIKLNAILVEAGGKIAASHLMTWLKWPETLAN